MKIIYSKVYEKARKVNVCYQHIGKCLALVFRRTVFVSWWRVYLLASSCLNWCLVEHSSVRTQRHSLVCLFFPHPTSCHTATLPHPSFPSVLTPPSCLSLTPSPDPLQKYRSSVLARMFTMSSFSFCVRNSELFSLPPPVFCPLSSFLSGVCVKCTLPWFFFIQYSVTCLCKFGLEKK